MNRKDESPAQNSKMYGHHVRELTVKYDSHKFLNFDVGSHLYDSS